MARLGVPREGRKDWSAIEQLRLEADLTQELLAERAGIPVSTLRKLERGYPVVKSPGVRLLSHVRYALEDALGRSLTLDDLCDPMWLVYEDALD